MNALLIGCEIGLHDANGIRPDEIEAVDLKVHPPVLNPMGRTDPRAGLEGKVSICYAVALVTGRGGEKDGRVLHEFIGHAVGSQASPMTDARLEGKVRDLCDGILPPDRTKRLIDLCWGAWDLPDAGDILRAGTVPAA